MRKLATALAVSIALSSGSARALGLGEIEMRSSLNQPMSAEIRLSSVRSGEMTGMIVKLASPEAFARAGIERTDALADLRFSVNQDTQTIVITSQRPIVEPFLNFLLEVDWPAGRMVREYTVLLDPPVFMSPNTSARADTGADSPAFVQRDDTSLVTPTPIQRESEIITDGELVSLESLDSVSGDTVILEGESVTLDGLEATTTFDTAEVGSVAIDEDPAIARARAAGAAARAAASSGTLTTQSSASVTFDSDVGGEVITLDGLGGDSTFGGGGEVISLTELGSSNLDANGLPQVELVGGGSEAGSGADTSNIVTLESIDAGSSSSDSVVVQRGETLGIIAQNLSGNGVSPQQMMMALLAANESAFINGNINLVRAGATLRVPSASEANGISQAQALASINDQNRLWQEYRDGVRSGQRATQVASASQAASAPARTQEPAEDTSVASLNDEAAAILANARTEVLQRDELKIVADSDSTTTAASATSDESAASDANRLGEINRKLQLAREELASSRRETDDLTDQSAALQNTGENLDTLVTLQQNDIAKLEAQLEAAKNEVTADASDAAGAADSLVDAAGDTLADASANVGDAASNLADSASDLVGGAASEASDAAGNAVTAAGEQLESVELLGDDATNLVADNANDTANAAAAATAAAASNAGGAAEEPKGWLDGVLNSNLKWGVLGVLGLGALGLLATLFMGRRKRKIDDADLDDVEFLDEMELADGTAATHIGDSMTDRLDDMGEAASSGVGAAAAAGGAGVAAAAAAVGFGRDKEDAADDIEAFDGTASNTEIAGAAAAFDSGMDDIDHDDTLSEVDVYLAYGLHGQAEELLGKAMDRDNNNPEYHEKLMETYAAQRNSDGYADVAAQYQQKFGTSTPAWAGIAATGHELDPGNALFSGAADNIESIGVGSREDAQSLNNDDFLTNSGSEEIASVNRDFSNATANDGDSVLSLPDFDSSDDLTKMADDEDESHLMDQSIDPAFAFDEADLEATGDFSQIADEIAADVGDDTSSLDFPSLDGATDSVTGVVGDAASGITDTASGIAGTVGDQASDAMNDMSLNVPTLDSTHLDAPNLDASALDVSGAAEDLTLDLNQLSGDMELDSTELLDDSLNADQSLDLNATSDDTLLAGTESLESVDEMDTMMDLAKAYIDMGDNDSASSALDEIVKSGSPEQVSEAETLKRKIS